MSALSGTVSGSGVTAVGGLIPSGCGGGGSVGISIVTYNPDCFTCTVVYIYTPPVSDTD